jgi:hypothetical protein
MTLKAKSMISGLLWLGDPLVSGFPEQHNCLFKILGYSLSIKVQ